ncbi:MAG: UMP kinase [bacterium]|nr:UMP kinase [bacterium]
MEKKQGLLYDKIVLKLTGQIFSTHDSLFNAPRTGRVVDEIKAVLEQGVKIAIVIGGGNIFRGRDVQMASFEAGSDDREAGDKMGMLGTAINSLFFKRIMKKMALKKRILTAIRMDGIAEYYTSERAQDILEQDSAVVIACGLGKPYCSTDYASVVYALDLGAKAVLKGTKVDGLYDKDPKTDKKAKLIPEISYKKAIGLGLEKIMDTSALGLVIDRKENLPIHIFNIFEKGNLLRLLSGEKIGSKIVP